MVSRLWRRKCKDRGREKHGFIVGVGYEEADALAL